MLSVGNMYVLVEDCAFSLSLILPYHRNVPSSFRQSLDSAVKKRKTSITKVTRKAEEIIAETKSVSYRATTVEQLLADFNTRWERLCTLLEKRKQRITQVSQDQKVSYIIEIITTLEIIIIEAEQELDRMGEIPDDETRIQEQKEIIQVGH